MKNTTIAALAGAITLALGMHSGMAADLKVNADSKIDQKPAQHTGATSAPTPGWEKLNKSKKWKSIESGSNQHHANNMKADSKVVPEHQGKSGVTMSKRQRVLDNTKSSANRAARPFPSMNGWICSTQACTTDARNRQGAATLVRDQVSHCSIASMTSRHVFGGLW